MRRKQEAAQACDHAAGDSDCRHEGVPWIDECRHDRSDGAHAHGAYDAERNGITQCLQLRDGARGEIALQPFAVECDG
jgi:hypothetical protein